MSEGSLFAKWARVWIAGGSIVLGGVLLFNYTTPTRGQLIASLSPELKAQYEREKKLREAEQVELMKIVQETMKSNDPIWKTGKIQSPWEHNQMSETSHDTKNNIREMDKRDHFEKVKADLIQREELDRISKELEQIRQNSDVRTREILDQKEKNEEKSWWRKLW
ncbi:related to Assembly factor CBP4 [Saccharomycodes ludwigii]|uniref:Cytochrome b mRNA-processing protein 4 n=1 Tax=Saccharomycodes ludwigii TaxID=36035 RepID=A0A376B2E7_9ASCO|nr:hypothetical protein SCDLUD_004478 [Saccharomycodes ludwigii]KAH3899056.1 hypothetical protein SCDLUD_004478 [Saccharomycodes ludwigii]SSD58821.1 related to Assembly factor CBP4 [Saccharomycodes ludwigii]